MSDIKDKRFCKLSKGKLGKKTLTQYAAAVAKPAHYCDSCLRVSSNKKNLCKPSRLP